MRYFFDANICLDLLDTTRPTSEASVDWYMQHKDDLSFEFFFSGDFISSFYYILTERRKISPHEVVAAIDALAAEITPFYIGHNDFLYAKGSFEKNECDDFEDLLIMHSAIRCGCSHFLTNDKGLLALSRFNLLQIGAPRSSRIKQ